MKLLKFTECCVCVNRGQEKGARDPGDPERDCDQHQDVDGVSLVVIVPNVLVLDAEDADQGDEEHDVGQGQEVVTGAEVAPGHQAQPLQGYHNLMTGLC